MPQAALKASCKQSGNSCIVTEFFFLTVQIFISHASRVKQVKILPIATSSGCWKESRNGSEEMTLRLRLSHYTRHALQFTLTPFPHPQKKEKIIKMP